MAIIEPDRATQLVYFVTGRATGFPIKIGRSTVATIRFRLRSIQTSLQVLVVTEAWPEMERELHDMFAHHRLHGEWFRRCEEITSLVKEIREAEPSWRVDYMPHLAPERLSLPGTISA